MTAWRRYLLIQIPGWAVAAILLSWMHNRFHLPLWMAVGLWLIYLAKDFAVYPFVRKSYEMNSPGALDGLRGARGIARQCLDPRGYVLVGGVLWMGEAAAGERPIPAGTPIRIETARDQVLIVTRD